MEITVTIKLPDGSTKTLELQNASINTLWANGLPTSIDPSQEQLVLMGNVTITGQIKSTFLVGSI